MPQISIQTTHRVIPYAYTTPETVRHDGWVKTGYTDRRLWRIHKDVMIGGLLNTSEGFTYLMTSLYYLTTLTYIRYYSISLPRFNRT